MEMESKKIARVLSDRNINVTVPFRFGGYFSIFLVSNTVLLTLRKSGRIAKPVL